MKKAAIYIMRFGLNLIYMFLKLLPTKGNKVLFLSRQSDKPTLDFQRIQSRLKEEQPNVAIVTICHRLEGAGSGGLINFAMSTLKSMYHMATARVCVLDAYWPAVSILHHKKQLKVIQLWHALGKIKQSGYQTLDKASGRSRQMAELMKMHGNYDYIIAGGRAWNPYYCQSFNTTEDKLVNCGLPRIDYLLETAEHNKQAVLKTYPQFADKTVILYAPTFRKNIQLHWDELAKAVQEANANGNDKSKDNGKDQGTDSDNANGNDKPKDNGGYVLIVKGHPNQKLDIDGLEGLYDCPEFQSVELLAACDYLITDYSAIAIEAAVLNKATYYYVYDYEEYREKNGMNIDLFDAMPGCVFRSGAALIEKIETEPYLQKALDNYRQKYLPENLGTSTEQICRLIRSCL